ncbi:MAG: peptidoglycan editing factor PgeF [Castellaniella sp.]
MEGLTRHDGLEVVSGSAWPGLRYFCTTRRGGVSAGPWSAFNLGRHVGDRDVDVEHNRQRLARTLPGPPLWLQQVHGVAVCDADRDFTGLPARVPQADAAVTTRAHRVLAVLTADCLPVVLGSVDGAVLGLAHAGWRGLLDGVLEATLAALQQRHPAGARAAWRAWIGPGIGPLCFEVGEEVRAAFMQADARDAAGFVPGERSGKWRGNLPALARARLHRAGVGHIEASLLCTHTEEDWFFSYRRSGVTGRQATLAWRSPAL